MRLHLLSRIVLLFVGGGLLFSNIHTEERIITGNFGSFLVYRYEHGWPVTYLNRWVDDSPWTKESTVTDTVFDIGALLFDTFVAVIICASAACVSEQWLRFRTDRLRLRIVDLLRLCVHAGLDVPRAHHRAHQFGRQGD